MLLFYHLTAKVAPLFFDMRLTPTPEKNRLQKVNIPASRLAMFAIRFL